MPCGRFLRPMTRPSSVSSATTPITADRWPCWENWDKARPRNQDWLSLTLRHEAVDDGLTHAPAHAVAGVTIENRKVDLAARAPKVIHPDRCMIKEPGLGAFYFRFG